LIIFPINFQGGTVLIWGFGKILLGKNTPPRLLPKEREMNSLSGKKSERRMIACVLEGKVAGRR
jgi:hypothetical protein